MILYRRVGIRFAEAAPPAVAISSDRWTAEVVGEILVCFQFWMQLVNHLSKCIAGVVDDMDRLFQVCHRSITQDSAVVYLEVADCRGKYRDGTALSDELPMSRKIRNGYVAHKSYPFAVRRHRRIAGSPSVQLIRNKSRRNINHRERWKQSPQLDLRLVVRILRHFSFLTCVLTKREENCQECNNSGHPTAECGYSCPIRTAYIEIREARHHYFCSDQFLSPKVASRHSAIAAVATTRPRTLSNVKPPRNLLTTILSISETRGRL